MSSRVQNFNNYISKYENQTYEELQQKISEECGIIVDKFVADLDKVNDNDYVVYGDGTNGEKLANTIGLNAFGGKMISPDAIINGNLTGEGNINDAGTGLKCFANIGGAVTDL